MGAACGKSTDVTDGRAGAVGSSNAAGYANNKALAQAAAAAGLIPSAGVLEVFAPSVSSGHSATAPFQPVHFSMLARTIKEHLFSVASPGAGAASGRSGTATGGGANRRTSVSRVATINTLVLRRIQGLGVMGAGGGGGPLFPPQHSMPPSSGRSSAARSGNHTAPRPAAAGGATSLEFDEISNRLLAQESGGGGEDSEGDDDSDEEDNNIGDSENFSDFPMSAVTPPPARLEKPDHCRDADMNIQMLWQETVQELIACSPTFVTAEYSNYFHLMSPIGVFSNAPRNAAQQQQQSLSASSWSPSASATFHHSLNNVSGSSPSEFPHQSLFFAQSERALYSLHVPSSTAVDPRRSSSGHATAAGGASIAGPTFEYFVSLADRAKLAGFDKEDTYVNVLTRFANAISAFLTPVVGCVTMIIAQSERQRKKRGNRGANGPIYLKKKWNPYFLQNPPGPDVLREVLSHSTLAGTVRHALQVLEEHRNPHGGGGGGGGGASTMGRPSSSMQGPSYRVYEDGLAGRALKMLHLLAGGSTSITADDRRGVGFDDDVRLAKALTIPAVDWLMSLTRAMGFDGSRGMHTTNEVDSWTAVLREVFGFLNLIPPKLEKAPFRVWMEYLPFFVFSTDAKQALLYLYAVDAGQSRLLIQPVLRSDVLSSAATSLKAQNILPKRRGSFSDYANHNIQYGKNNNPQASSRSTIANNNNNHLQSSSMSTTSSCGQQSSYKVFPTFLTEGVGLESGEGHGPRKEFFDGIAAELTATRSPPMDLSSAVSVQVVSSIREVNPGRIATGVSTAALAVQGNPVCLLQWRQSKLIPQFRPGDMLLVNLEQRANEAAMSASARGGSVFTPVSAAECWIVEKELPAHHGAETILVLSTREAKIANGYRVVGIKAECLRSPLFLQETGNSYCWLNPQLPVPASSSSSPSPGRGGAQQQASSSTRRGDIQSFEDDDDDGDLVVTSSPKGSPLAAAAAGVASDPSALMWTAGWATAQSVANGVVSPVSLPPFLFRKLRFILLAIKHQNPEKQQLHEPSLLNVAPSELCLVGERFVEAAEQILKLSKNDFEMLLLSEELDPSSTSREQYLATQVASEGVWSVQSDVLVSKKLMLQLLQGMTAASFVAQCPLISLGCCSRELRKLFCGPVDDIRESFEFSDVFRLVCTDRDMPKFPQNRIFYHDVLLPCLEEDFCANGASKQGDEGWHESDASRKEHPKRTLLKFITGRSLLPPRKRSEHIKIEFPFAPMTAKEFDVALTRLPSSHSCDNVLEVVNVLECLLFSSKSPAYTRGNRAPGSVVMDSFKADVWGLFSSEEQLQLIDKSRALLREKLTSAVFMSGTYELDEGAISNAARQAMSGSTSRTSLNHSTNKYHSNTVGGGGGLPPYVSSSTTRINVNASQSNNNATPSRSTNAGSVWGHGAGGVSGLNQRGPTTTAMDHLTQSSGSFHVGPTMTPEHSAAASNNVIARRLSQGAGLAAVQRFDEEDDDDEVDYFPNRGQGTSHNNNNVAKMNQNFAAATKQPTPLYGSSGGVGGALPSQHSVANSGVLLRGGGGGGHHSTTLFSPSKTDTVEIGSPLEQRPAGGTAAAAAARNTASQAPPPPPANPNSLLGALPPLPVRNVSPMPTPQRLGVFQRTTLVEDDIESEDLTNTPRQQHQKQGGGGGGGGGTTTGSRAGGGAPVHRSKDLDNLMTELFPK